MKTKKHISFLNKCPECGSNINSIFSNKSQKVFICSNTNDIIGYYVTNYYYQYSSGLDLKDSIMFRVKHRSTFRFMLFKNKILTSKDYRFESVEEICEINDLKIENFANLIMFK